MKAKLCKEHVTVFHSGSGDSAYVYWLEGSWYGETEALKFERDKESKIFAELKKLGFTQFAGLECLDRFLARREKLNLPEAPNPALQSAWEELRGNLDRGIEPKEAFPQEKRELAPRGKKPAPQPVANYGGLFSTMPAPAPKAESTPTFGNLFPR